MDKKKINKQLYKSENDAIKTKINFPVKPIISTKELQERIREIEYKKISDLNKGTLKDLNGKPSKDKKTHAQRNIDYFHPIKGAVERGKSEWRNDKHIVQTLGKTVGASATLATGAAYTSPVVGTWAGLGKNIIAGAVGTIGYSGFEGRTPTKNEYAYGVAAEMGIPLAIKGAEPIIKPIAKKIDNVVNYLNAPKFNAKPEAYYRVIGNKDGLNDAITSNVLRPNQNGIFKDRSAYYTKGAVNDSSNPVVGGGVKKGTAYKGKYIAEVLPGNNYPQVAKDLNPEWNFGLTRNGEHIPTNSENVKLYKKDWLKGYREIAKTNEKKTGNLIDKVLNLENKVSRVFEIPLKYNGNKTYMSELGKGYKGQKQIKSKNLTSDDTFFPYTNEYEKYVRNNYIKSSGVEIKDQNDIYHINELGPFSLAHQTKTQAQKRIATKISLPIVGYTALGTANAITGNVITNNLQRRAGMYNKDLSRNDTIIDLTNRKMRYTKNGDYTDGKTILGGEFIERTNNSVRTKREWSNSNPNDTFSDKNIKINSIKNFYGIEDGKLKIGSLDEFQNKTELVPIRFNSDKIIKDVSVDNEGLNLFDDKGEKIYHNIKGGGKVILYDNVTKNKQFIFASNSNFAKNAIKEFMKNNNNTQILTMDNGRYAHYLDNKDGLKPEDFVKYSSYDFKRSQKTGYNLVVD